MIYGYARVSTVGQTLEAQFEALEATGAQQIFHEKMSGARSDRPELGKLLKALSAGDMVIVTRLDRLARSSFDLLSIAKAITDKGANFRSLADGWADTTTPTGRLMVTVMAGLAEFERELIRARTMDGRARAVAQGKKMGRRLKLTRDQRAEAIEELKAGTRQVILARRYNVSVSLISRLASGL